MLRVKDLTPDAGVNCTSRHGTAYVLLTPWDDITRSESESELCPTVPSLHSVGPFYVNYYTFNSRAPMRGGMRTTTIGTRTNTPLRDGKRNVVVGLYHITVPFVLSGYLCFRFQHTNHTKVVKIHKVISIVINSILWNHTNQLPPCHVIKLLHSFIVIIILWVIAMWKLTLAYLSWMTPDAQFVMDLFLRFECIMMQCCHIIWSTNVSLATLPTPLTICYPFHASGIH